MTETLRHPDGLLHVTPRDGGGYSLVLEPTRPGISSKEKTLETGYSLQLIEKIFDIKGPGSVLDEIRREEDSQYARICLETDLLGYLPEKAFISSRMLDFGCGSGASTMILARLFPDTEIVGIDLAAEHLEIARMRAEFYGYNNLKFIHSPAGDSIPEGTGEFDHIVLSAVYEHLLPEERKSVLKVLWRILRPGGCLFIDQTPYRWFPFEGHTSRLPLINYLPDGLAGFYARTCSKRIGKGRSWESMLRSGIRGGSVSQVRSILQDADDKYMPEILLPSRLGCRDRVDLWYKGYAVSIAEKYPWAGPVQRVLRWVAKGIYKLTGVVFLPALSLAVRKEKAEKHGL